MKDKVKDYLTHKIDGKVLFAVESGSRAWKIESLDSDYDIRFVFYHSNAEYLKLFTQRKDVISEMFEEKGIKFDYEGWDLFKYLRLLAKSNPTVLEWLRSPIVYIDSDFKQELLEITDSFSRFTLFKHYISLANGQYKKYLFERIDPSLKKYLYVIRGQLNAIYIYLKNKFPPMDIFKLITSLKKSEKSNNWDINIIVPALEEMLRIKKSGHEYDNFRAPPEVNFWIAETFDQLQTLDDEMKERDQKYNISLESLEEILDKILQNK